MYIYIYTYTYTCISSYMYMSFTTTPILEMWPSSVYVYYHVDSTTTPPLLSRCYCGPLPKQVWWPPVTTARSLIGHKPP